MKVKYPKEARNVLVNKKLKIKKHKTLEERFKEFRKLKDEEKGQVEDYDWGNDVGLEKI